MRRFTLLFLCAVGCFGQSFGVGIKGGFGLNDSFSTGSGSKDYVVGPTFEIRLPFSLAIEADALYRPLNYNFLTVNPSGVTSASGSINTWEIPIVAKVHLHFPIVRPYVEAGPSFRALGNLGSVLSASSERLSDKGFTLGAGVEFKVPFLRLSPEIRYTHWGSDYHVPSIGAISSNQNQAELLLGVSF